MATVEDIESAVARLSQADYTRFLSWLLEYDNQIWDKQMAGDAESGRLDALAAEALSDLHSGRCTDL